MAGCDTGESGVIGLGDGVIGYFSGFVSRVGEL